MNKPITKKNWSYKYMPYATLPWPSFSSAALVLASCITLSVSSGTLRELFSRKSLGCGRNKSRSGPGKRNVARARRKQFKLHYTDMLVHMHDCWPDIYTYAHARLIPHFLSIFFHVELNIEHWIKLDNTFLLRRKLVLHCDNFMGPLSWS